MVFNNFFAIIPTDNNDNIHSFFILAGFGTSTGTSLFGQQQSTGLFGQQNKTPFGTTTAANTGLGFGTNTRTRTSLFGQQQKLVMI